MTTDEQLARRLGNTAAVLRWLAAQLAAEKHPLAHVPAELACSLVTAPAVGCRSCGGSLPPRERTGRPRVLCLECSPRKTPEKSTIAETSERRAS